MRSPRSASVCLRRRKREYRTCVKLLCGTRVLATAEADRLCGRRVPAWSNWRDERLDGNEPRISPAGIDARGGAPARNAPTGGGEMASLVLHRRSSIWCSTTAITDSSEARRASKSPQTSVCADLIAALHAQTQKAAMPTASATRVENFKKRQQTNQ